jgi:hypothetical protein
VAAGATLANIIGRMKKGSKSLGFFFVLVPLSLRLATTTPRVSLSPGFLFIRKRNFHRSASSNHGSRDSHVMVKEPQESTAPFSIKGQNDA